MRSQSAMEYLMTYGWAILIIAIVLGALYSIGVFNSTNFAPRASPGLCRVFRSPASGAQLEGRCVNALPRSIARFNGQDSYISIQNGAVTGSAPYTKSAWVYLPAGVVSGYLVMDIFCWGNYGWIHQVNCLRTGNVNNQFTNYHWSDDIIWTSTHIVNGWNFVAVAYDGSKEYGYVNGILEGTSATNPNVAQTAMLIGKGYSGDNIFNGYIANIQLYNASFSQNDIKTLYAEGIGGDPFNLRYLVGWWPLNGDAQDYSGNNNNGQVNGNLAFINSWNP